MAAGKNKKTRNGTAKINESLSELGTKDTIAHYTMPC